jgi:pyridoxal phosphate enzyme (YggS family)
MNIEKNLKTVDNLVKSAVSKAKLSSKPPKLIAVSKRQPEKKIEEALKAGHRIYGENRLQEATERWKERKEQFSDLELHFIGNLQSKKAAGAVELCDFIHSVDRPSLAKAMAKAMDATGRRPDCFIQINTGEEAQKSGILPKEAPAFIKECQENLNLPIIGLMCLPPQGVNPVPHFAFLKKLAEDHNLHHLSMGMSADWELAVRMGSTHIRLGTAIFGERE